MTTNSTLLLNRVVAITGASSGIGASLAVGFAAAGARVALLARRHERLTTLANQLGPECAAAIATDVTDYAAVVKARDEILLRWGRVQVLVNNAGVYPPEEPLWRTTPADWQGTIETNLTGVFYGIHAFLPGMISGGYGRIINVSSPMIDTPNALAYSLTKTAVDTLTAVLAEELREQGADIIVSCVDPGNVRTEMNPEGQFPPGSVLPLFLKLASLPSDAPSGRKWSF